MNIFTDPVFYNVNLPPSLQKSQGISYTTSKNRRCTVLGPGGAGGAGGCIMSQYPGGGGGGGGGSSIIIFLKSTDNIYLFPGIGGKAIKANNGENGSVTAIILNDNFTLIVPGGKGGQVPTLNSGGNGGDGGDQPYLILNDDPKSIVPYTYSGQNIYTIIQSYQCYGGGAGVNVLNENLSFISGTPGKGYPNSNYSGAKANLINVNGKNYYLSGAGGGLSSPWGGNFISEKNGSLYASGGSGGSYGTDSLPIIVGELRFNPILGLDKNVSQSGIGASNEKVIINNFPITLPIPIPLFNTTRIALISPKMGAPGGGGGGGAVFLDTENNRNCIGPPAEYGGNGKIIFNL